MVMSADIDIDVPDRSRILELIRHTPARQVVDGRPRKHNSGIYITDIPQDPEHGCAAIDYESAEQRGYFKIDLLNMSVYQLIQDPAHYEAMLSAAPPWSRLWTDQPGPVSWFTWATTWIYWQQCNLTPYPGWLLLLVLLDRAKHTYSDNPGMKCLHQCGMGMNRVGIRLKSHTL
jgi:hypothetical protein